MNLIAFKKYIKHVNYFLSSLNLNLLVFPDYYFFFNCYCQPLLHCTFGLTLSGFDQIKNNYFDQVLLKIVEASFLLSKNQQLFTDFYKDSLDSEENDF